MTTSPSFAMSSRAAIAGLVLLMNVIHGIAFDLSSFIFNQYAAKLSMVRASPCSINKRQASLRRGFATGEWLRTTSRTSSLRRSTHTKLNSVLDPNDAWALRATVTAAAAAGLSLGQTSFGKAVSHVSKASNQNA